MLALVLLGGCASTEVPEMVRLDGAEGMSVAQAQTQPEQARGKAVRWGGEILSVHNQPQFTEVVVLRRGLFSGGEPRPDGGEGKRFVARIPGFLDPAEYRAKQRLTVVGRLAGNSLRKVGEYAYPHPVVEVQSHYRWDEYKPAPVPRWHRDPFYCDPLWPWGYRHPYCW